MFVSTISQSWKLSLKFCKDIDYRPSIINDIVDPNTWIGKAIYERYWGKTFDSYVLKPQKEQSIKE